MIWWHRFLLHPALLAPALARWLAPAAGIAGVVWLAGWVRRSRARAWAVRRARWVEIRPPVHAGPEDGERFWLGVARLLRRRRRGWEAHVVFELAWSGQRLRLGVWVPGLVAAGQVARIAESAWPGASARLREGAPPAFPDGAVAAGGELAASGGRDWLPLRAGHKADPLREVFGHGLYLGAGDLAMVQVAARPAGASRVARARAGAASGRAGARGAAGLAAAAGRRLVLGVLDVVTDLMRPGPSAPARRAAYGPAAWEGQDPFGQARQRSAVAKLTGPPLWEVAVRYTAATTALAGPAAAGRARAGRDALGAAFGAFAGEMDLDARPVRDPAGTLASRRLRRGFLAGTGELAALAHLPFEPGTVPGLEPPGARPVAPPPGIRRADGRGW
ncbi:MAG TPA: hypothetical protein VNF47_14465 [Streptosporangiaceae bacterium]|nr:hypothetical protein [Streptosporangiaceae bacterium]